MFERDLMQYGRLNAVHTGKRFELWTIVYLISCVIVVFSTILVHYNGLIRPISHPENHAELALWSVKMMAIILGPMIIILALIGAGVPEILRFFIPADKRNEIKTLAVVKLAVGFVAMDVLLLGTFIGIDPAIDPFWASIVVVLLLAGSYKILFD
jgi:hypothetical protein